jgi:hypothetical protein
MPATGNGTGLTSNAMLKWQHDRGVEWHHVATGRPKQKGVKIEWRLVEWRAAPNVWTDR